MKILIDFYLILFDSLLVGCRKSFIIKYGCVTHSLVRNLTQDQKPDVFCKIYDVLFMIFQFSSLNSVSMYSI